MWSCMRYFSLVSEFVSPNPTSKDPYYHFKVHFILVEEILNPLNYQITTGDRTVVLRNYTINIQYY